MVIQKTYYYYMWLKQDINVFPLIHQMSQCIACVYGHIYIIVTGMWHPVALHILAFYYKFRVGHWTGWQIKKSYNRTCLERPLMARNKSGHLRQVAAYNRLTIGKIQWVPQEEVATQVRCLPSTGGRMGRFDCTQQTISVFIPHLSIQKFVFAKRNQVYLPSSSLAHRHSIPLSMNRRQ